MNRCYDKMYVQYRLSLLLDIRKILDYGIQMQTQRKLIKMTMQFQTIHISCIQYAGNIVSL